MKQKLAKFMYGRYGTDQLSKALSIGSLIVLVVSMFLGSDARSFILVLVLASLIYSYFRTFSKNIAARRRENDKYLALKGRFTHFFTLRRDMWKQRREYKFFKCPSCKAVLRVPVGKGKLKIVCKKCGTAFERKT